MFTEDLLEELSKQMQRQPATLFQILKLAQEDEELWTRITNELAPENPSAASEFLASLLEIYETVGENDSAALTAYDIIHVALHNALGCSESEQRLSSFSEMIPCTHAQFKTVRRDDSYYIIFVDQVCPHTKTKSKQSSRKKVT